MPALPRSVRTAVALVTAATLLMTLPPSALAGTVGGDGKPITNSAGVTFGVAAHRGGALEWPENSLDAFAASAAAGFDSIETDILFTKDGRAVLSHNDKLPTRCTNAGKSIHRLTLAQVELVRCADLTGRKVVPITTFEQLTSILTAHRDVGLILDIKSYSGQTASGQRKYAAKAIALVKKHELLDRTSIISFHWKAALPAIRKAAPKVSVLALDTGAVDLDRVRLAAKLGANGYGIRMKDTSAYLARYVKSRGMDSAPWAVQGDEQRAFVIHYAGLRQLLLTDAPTNTRADLIAGRIDLNPVPRPVTTTLTKPITISSTTYKVNKRQYKKVLGKAVPAARVAQLDTVTVAITVHKGPGKGRVHVGANSSPLSSSARAALPKGTKTIQLKTPLGDGGKLRIHTTKKVKLTVKVLAYTRIRF